MPACLHDEISSFCLFKEAKSGLQIIKYFSQRHRLHLLEVGLYEVACLKILHVTLKFVKFSFKYHMYLLSEEAINLMKENAIPKNTKHATKFEMTHFKGKM